MNLRRTPSSALGNGSARSLLLTVLGEFVHPAGGPVWTSSLLYVLEGVGVPEQTARQAIARGAAAGWMSGTRVGREVRWDLTDAGRALIAEGAERVYSVGTEPKDWDGNWLVLMVTISQSARAARRKLYAALGWAGFGNPAPSLWLSPHVEREAEAKRAVEALGVAESTFSFVGPSTSIGLCDEEIVRRAWDLDAVAVRYQALIDRFSELRPAPGDPTLFTHVLAVNEWQRFPYMDPQLPEALLPDWIGRRAARLLQRLRSEWGGAAHARWDEVVSLTAGG